MNVGENIKKIRELKNYSQAAMADRLDIGQKTYSNIENAGNNITIALIEKVAKVLEVSFNRILELNVETILNSTNQSGGIGSQLNYSHSYNYLNDKQNELYEKLLAEKDKVIKMFEKQLNSAPSSKK